MSWHATLYTALEALRGQGPLSKDLTAVLSWAAPDTRTKPLAEPGPEARYEDLGLVTRGGMGELRRVRDLRLNRVLVQKVLFAEHAHLTARFWTEACVTARLEHPSIIPVHDFGFTSEDRPFFTMTEVQGSTLGALSRNNGAPDSPGLHRLVEALLRVCEATAMAHDQGICHRDIKPDNIMVGRFGQVLLLDWGLARPCGEVPEFVAGTPGFMPPEQAKGEMVATQADVFALGATLASLLRSSEHPAAELAVLEDLCERAGAEDPWDRPPDAESFGDVLRDWLHQASRQREAQELYAQAAELQPEILERRETAKQARSDAAQLLGALPLHAPTTEKAPAWALEDRAKRLDAEIVQMEAATQAMLQNALGRSPSYAPAHQLLADLSRVRAERATERGDSASAAFAEAMVRRHDRGPHSDWLAGLGRVTLRLDPPTRLQVFALTEQGRRLVPTDTGTSFAADGSPLVLPHGSYVAETASTDRRHAIPFVVDRGGKWPPEPQQEALRLPAPGSLAADDCWVPAGWAQLGDAHAKNGLPRYAAHVDSFVIKRDPVTNREYLAFLNDLAQTGRLDQAQEHVPKEGRVSGDSGGTPIFQRDEAGLFILVEDATGDLWHPDWPVVLIPWASAVAYAAWRAAREGLPWRLPTEVEREKAGRGVDGRAFPWGEAPEATWTVCRPGQAGRATPQPVGATDTDCSVYGVRGCAGNSRDWCSDPFDPNTALSPAPHPGGWRNTKGGSWASGMGNAHLGSRFGVPATQRLSLVGLRLARSMP